jgi:signal transduction histidine kinase
MAIYPRIPHSSIACLLIVLAGTFLVKSMKEPQDGLIDFPVLDGDSIGFYYSAENVLDWDLIQTHPEAYFIPATSVEDPKKIPLMQDETLSTWIRIPLKNESSQMQRYVLEVATKWIDFATLYTSLSDGTYTKLSTGEGIDYNERALPSRRPAFALSIAPESEKIYYLQLVENNHIFLPIIKLWDSKGSYYEMMRTENVRIGFHFSLYFSIFIFSAIAYMVIRSRDLLYYLIYMVVASYTQMSCFNLQSVIYPLTRLDGIWFSDLFFPLLSVSKGIFALFTLEFLETKKHLPRTDRLVRICSWIYIITIPVLVSGMFHLSFLLDYAPPLYGGILFTLVCLLVAVARLFQGCQSAYYYLLAFAIYTYGMFRLVASGFTDIEPPPILVVQWLFGFSFEVTVLTIALGDRFLALRREKESAQEQALTKALEVNKMQREYTDKLHAEVEQQVSELKSANARKDTLFSIIGCHLKAPLEGLSAISEQVAKIPRDHQSNLFKRHADRLLLLSSSMSEHLENLLLWAQLQIEELPFQPKDYALIDIIEPIVAQFAALPKNRSIDLDIQVDEEIYVFADLRCITNAIQNILAEAEQAEPISTAITIQAQQNEDRVVVKFTNLALNLNSTSATSDHKISLRRRVCHELLALHHSLIATSPPASDCQSVSFSLKKTSEA